MCIRDRAESGFEHDPHEKDEDREPQHFMGYEQIYDLGACRFFYFVLLVGLTQCTGNKTVAGIGEGCLTIFFQKGFDSVSYTHLDVYKRQEYAGRPIRYFE